MEDFDFDYDDTFFGEDYNTFEQNCLDEDRFLGEYDDVLEEYDDDDGEPL